MQTLSPFKYYNPISKSKEVSPIKISHQIQSIRDSIEVSSFDFKGDQQVYKCCQIRTDYQEKSMDFDFNYESVPKMLKKLIPQELHSS